MNKRKIESVAIGLACLALSAAILYLLAANADCAKAEKQLQAENEQLRQDLEAQITLAALAGDAVTIYADDLARLAAENDQLRHDLEAAKYPDPLDRECEQASQDWGTTLDMGNGFLGYADKWKEKTELYYRFVHAELDDDNKSRLEASQARWNAFADANDELYYHAYWQKYATGGTMRRRSNGPAAIVAFIEHGRWT